MHNKCDVCVCVYPSTQTFHLQNCSTVFGDFFLVGSLYAKRHQANFMIIDMGSK
jgi:hypothetical protein